MNVCIYVYIYTSVCIQYIQHAIKNKNMKHIHECGGRGATPGFTLRQQQRLAFILAALGIHFLNWAFKGVSENRGP